MPRVPQREQHLPHAVADALLGDDEVPAAQDRRCHEEPAHRVGTVAVEDLVDVRVVLQRLGHLLSVGAEHDAVADDVLVGRAVEQRGREDVHRVEPAAGLPDVLDDEVRRVVGIEPLLVLHRVVHLGVGHRAGVEPDVENVLDPAHHRLAGRVVGVRAHQVVDERAVQVDLAVVVAGQAAEGLLDLGEGTVDFAARVVGVVGLPHRDRRAPVAVAADGPVAGVLKPLAELAVLDVLGDPVDLLVQLQHAVLDLGHLDVPGGDRTVDQRGAAAPAVRVGVHVAGLLDQPPGLLHDARDGLVGVERLHADDLGEVAAGEDVEEPRPRVDGEHHGDPGGLADRLVLLTVGGCLVDEARAVSRGDIVGDEESPSVLSPPLLRVGEGVPQGLVGDVGQVGAAEGAGHGVGGGSRVVVPEILGVVAQQIGGEQERPGGRGGFDAGGAGRHDDVFDVGPDREGGVGRQGPRGRGPGEGLHAGQTQRLGLLTREREGDGHGLVLAVLVDVVVHA